MDYARLQTDLSQLNDKVMIRIGALQQEIESLKAEIEALKTSRVNATPTDTGYWVEIGRSEHTITHIARAKDAKNNMLLLLWSKGAKFAISYYWWNDKERKDELMAEIETLSGVKFGVMPWIADVKAITPEQMTTCQPFVFCQVIKQKGDKKKYFPDSLSALGTPPQTPQNAHSATIPQLTRDYDLNIKILHAWQYMGMPEVKARNVLQDILQERVADATLYFLAQAVTLNADLLEKGLYVPVEAKTLEHLYLYGRECYELAEDEVKTILKWTKQVKLRADAMFPTEIEKFRLWHFEFMIDLAYKEAKVKV